MHANNGKKIKQITIKQNPHFSGIEVKLGKAHYSRYSHIHQAWSFSYVLQGKTTVSLGIKKLELTENMFIAIPPGVPHLCSPAAENRFGFAVLYLPATLFALEASEFIQPRVGKIESNLVYDMLDRFIQMSDPKEVPGSGKYLKETLEKHSSPLADDWGVNLLHKETFPIRDFSKGSRFQQYRYMRKHFGISQKKLSTIEKMEMAKVLMTERRNLAEIALACGCYDQSHFSKVFKLYTGLTPAQYMNK